MYKVASPAWGDCLEGSRGWNEACVSCGRYAPDAVHQLDAPCLGCGADHHAFVPFVIDGATLEERTRPLPIHPLSRAAIRSLVRDDRISAAKYGVRVTLSHVRSH